MKTKLDRFVIERVKARRTELSLSQAALAYALDVSEGFIGKIESPKFPAKYNIHHLNELAKLMKCSPKDFLPEKPL